MSCPLCRLYEKREIITRLYYEDDVCIVVDCSTHHVPIIVLKRHAKTPKPEELKHMRKIAEKLFPGKPFRGPRSILDHFHLHSV